MESFLKKETSISSNPLYFETKGSAFNKDYILELIQAENVDFKESLEKIKELWNKNKNQLESLNEAQLERTWIRPILDILGWEFEVQVSFQAGGKRIAPDYALFTDELKKNKSAKAKNNFLHASLVGDAKTVGENLDGKNTYQITSYMYHTRKKWGLLTNGFEWRLYYQSLELPEVQYYEINLEDILCSICNSQKKDHLFKYFFLFFRKDSFLEKKSHSFIDKVIDQSLTYSRKLNDNLKDDILPVVESICNGFVRNKKSLKDEGLKEIYENAMHFSFKLIFILNFEDRDLLEVDKAEDYFEDYSLRKKILDLKKDKDEGEDLDWSEKSHSLYDSIFSLFDVLKKGAKNIGVGKLNGDIFECGDQKFYKDHKIKNKDLKEILLKLSFHKDKRIDYSLLSVDHLGSIFEGILENKPVIKNNKIILLNDKGERKGSGSYYTPSFVCDALVEKALEEKVKNCKTVNEILNIRVSDIAFGSGHFLLSAIRYLERKIHELQNDEDYEGKKIKDEKIKSEILYNCLYGVDINPIAVELGKIACYIEIAYKKHTFKSLKDNFKCGDSLLDSEFNFKNHFKDKFDAIVGNPPWEKLKCDEDRFWALKFPETKIIQKKQNEKKKIINYLKKKHPDQYINFQEEKRRVDHYKEKLRSLYNLGIGDTDLYKAFSWRFFELVKDAGTVSVLFPRQAFRVKGNEIWRKNIIENYQLKSIITLENKKKWVFKEVHPQYAFCLTVIKKKKPDGFISIHPRYTNLEDFLTGISEGVKPMTLNDFKLWGDSLITPSFKDKDSIPLFNKMAQNFKLTNQFNFKFVSEFHPTHDKKHFVFNNKKINSKKNYLNVYKGESFNIWESDTKKYYGWAEKSYITKVLFEKRLRASKSKNSIFSKFSDKFIKDSRTLHFLKPRVSFRDITGSTNNRTMLACLIAPNVILTGMCPYLCFVNKNEKTEAYTLGIFNSMVFDWYIRHLVELHLNYSLFDSFPFPALEDKSPLKKKIIKIAGRLSAQDHRFKDWADKVGVKCGKLDEEEKQNLIYELDALVAKAFNLTEDEIAHIYKTFHKKGQYDERCERVLNLFNKLKKAA